MGEVFVNSLIHISSGGGGGGGGGNGIGEGDGGGGDWRLIKGAETRVRGIGDDGKGGNENDNIAAEVMVRKVSTEEDGENKVEKGGADLSGHDNSPLMARKEQTAINTFIESIHLLLFCLSSSCLLCLCCLEMSISVRLLCLFLLVRKVFGLEKRRRDFGGHNRKAVVMLSVPHLTSAESP